MDRYIRIGDAAIQLGVSVDTLRRWAEEGIVAAYRSPSGHIRFRQRDLQSLMNRRVKPRRDRRYGPAAETAGDNDVEDYDAPRQRSASAPKWQELAPWQQRRAEVETELEIERLTARREQERAEAERSFLEEEEREAEQVRLTALKQFGKVCCWSIDATTEVIKELETFVTTAQIPPWLSQWEQNNLVQQRVFAVMDRVRAEKAAKAAHENP